jgi:hypothetical protein
MKQSHSQRNGRSQQKACQWQRQTDKATHEAMLIAREAQEKKPLFTDNGAELEQTPCS